MKSNYDMSRMIQSFDRNFSKLLKMSLVARKHHEGGSALTEKIVNAEKDVIECFRTIAEIWPEVERNIAQAAEIREKVAAAKEKAESKPAPIQAGREPVKGIPAKVG